MTDFDAEGYSEAELVAEFKRLFPHGFAGPDVLEELAPDGWETSPLITVFHPGPARLFEESLNMHRNVCSLRKPDDDRPLPPEPTLELFAKDYRECRVETETEVRELVGLCLWDVFSDGHDVVASDGCRLDLGSFRGSGGFLADVLNRQTGTEQYDYLNFYMGTIWVAGRADLAPVYRMIFRRLRARGLDWLYHFPRLHAVDLRPLRDALKREDEPDWTGYEPSAALAEDEAEREQDKNLAELRDSLAEGYRESVEQAMGGPPPATVLAYEAVFGCFPRGWPPSL